MMAGLIISSIINLIVNLIISHDFIIIFNYLFINLN